MKLFIAGTGQRAEELAATLPSDAEILQVDHLSEASHEDLEDADIIFDLNADEDDDFDFSSLLDYTDRPIFLSAVKKQLAELVQTENYEPSLPVFGVNALPTFIDRPLKEVSLYDKAAQPALEESARMLGWEIEIVADRVGMVSPRVIFMIINEACYTVQEGTASMADIDLGMKLGTGYPMGPFEWADKVGIKDVYETLDAVFIDTIEERYKICPLMKTHYLKDLSFLGGK